MATMLDQQCWEDACEAPEHEARVFPGFDELREAYINGAEGMRQPPSETVAHLIMTEALELIEDNA